VVEGDISLMSFVARPLLVGIFVLTLVAAPSARAQSTRSWTGLASPDNHWTVLGNWNTGVPVSGDTALFNGSGNTNTNISLGAATQPINTIRFDGAIATPYTVGVLASGDKFNFDAGGAITVASNIAVLQTINAAIQANGALTVTNSGSVGLSLGGDVNFASAGTLAVNNAVANTTTTLGGNITDAVGQPGSLSLTALDTNPSNNNNFIINGTNTYTGPTSIQVNTGDFGSIQLGSNSPFGTGPVSITLVGATAPRFNALTSTRTISNSINLSSGMTFVGSNSIALTGPITIINPIASGTRSFINSITTAGKTVTLGASPSSSTITLGNPVANGGDGVGKAAIFSPAAGATTIINDIMQDPAAGSGAASGSVHYSGSTGGVSRINGLSTYTGATYLDGFSTVKIASDYNIGGTSGPFGLGTLTLNNTVTQNILEPIGGNRSIANPVSLALGGLTIANDTADTSSLTLSGPISMLASGRFLTNNFAANGGTLTLGSAASPSTITLPNTASQVFTLAGTGTTIINDVIQNPVAVPSPAPAFNITNSGTTALNALNTYTGGTTLSGNGAVFRIGASSNALPGPSFTAGPFGTGTVTTGASTTPVIFQPFGADRTVANPINITFGFVTSNPTLAQDPTGNHNLSLTGPITLGGTGRTITNNLASGVALTLGSAITPSTISIGSTLTIRTQTAGGGSTIINDAINGIGGVTVQDSAVVQLNGASSYTGTTSVTGTGTPKLFVNGSKSGSGAVTIDAVGTLGGTGTITGAIANSGTIAPGNGVGTLTATDTVTMNPNSHLAIELSAGSADKLVVGGNLNLSNVDFLDVSGAGQGLSWVIATYGTLTGTFNNITSGYTVNYGTGTNSQITLNKPATGVNGDFNNDGKVDAQDYITWRKNNTTSNPLPNDNGLGTPIGPSHYTLWRSNFGKPPGSGSGDLVASGAVPEPASLLLAVVAIFGFSAVGARRRAATLPA
jgi:fibronectin-binding autotransporter adhesin